MFYGMEGVDNGVHSHVLLKAFTMVDYFGFGNIYNGCILVHPF
jgi:hypothetical protein